MKKKLPLAALAAALVVPAVVAPIQGFADAVAQIESGLYFNGAEGERGEYYTFEDWADLSPVEKGVLVDKYGTGNIQVYLKQLNKVTTLKAIADQEKPFLDVAEELQENEIVGDFTNGATGEDFSVYPTPTLPELTIESVTNPADITVVVGTAPALPETVEVEFEGGTTGEVAVTWEESDFSEAGTVEVTGTIAGTDKTATINVIVKSVEDLNAAIAAVKSTSETGNSTDFKTALTAPVLGIEGIEEAYLDDYQSTIADALSITSVADIQALVNLVNDAKSGEEAELVAAIKAANTVSTLEDALAEAEIVHVSSITSNLNAYSTAIKSDNPISLADVQVIIDATNLDIVETAVAKAEASEAAADVTAAANMLTNIESVHPDFDTPAEGEKSFAERIAAVLEAIDAATELEGLITAANEATDEVALLAALQALETADLIEGVVASNDTAYFAAKTAETKFVRPEDIQTFVTDVNAAELADKVEGLVAAVNEAADVTELAAALDALKEAGLLVNYETANDGAYDEASTGEYASVDAIQTFVDDVNAAEALKAALVAINELDSDSYEEDVLEALKAEALALTGIVDKNVALYTAELPEVAEEDTFADTAAVQALVDTVNATNLGKLNAAKKAADVKVALVALEADGLDLELYNELTSAQQTLIATSIARDSDGITTVEDLQEAIDMMAMALIAGFGI
ncbi:Ig-like domain-containing protein [Sporosarcina sp. FSL K6-3457]|uniref:Ig-like domain-containing protein n=1 Tax=Sporosarcina sp. FSL K6-3457 TaxID=2978204 RepID=UPI0030FA3984